MRVVTDRWGIAHIHARSLHDLYRAWGWVTARDRLWQLALTRAQGRGDLHRWLGNDVLRADGGAQLFRFRERADSIWARDRADTALSGALDAYAAGINDHLADCEAGREPWPGELQRSKWHPEPWKAEDSVMLLLGLGLTLDLEVPELGEAEELEHWTPEQVERRHAFEGQWMYDSVPDSAARRLWPPAGPAAGRERATESAARAAGSDVSAHPGTPASSRSAFRAALTELEALRPQDPALDLHASNEFAVGAGRSASGAPLLANDPHLALTTPGALHVVHLSVPGMVEAIGASVPGLPAIVSGRNERVAWGVTALSADVCDVYADSLSSDGRHVVGLTGEAAVVTLPYALSFRVLGVPLPAFGQVRRYTPHGPVLVWEPKKRRAYSLRWSAFEDARISLARMVGVERSGSAAEVAERFRTLVTPTISLVAADVGGDVRWQATGLVPRRVGGARRGPLAGDGRHEWPGFIPPDSMPAWRAPRDGWVVNSNNRPVGAAYPYVWPRYEWAHDRAWRIHERLASIPRPTLADLAAIQGDVHSRSGDRWLPVLLGAAGADPTSLTARARQALDSLASWNGEVTRDRVAPTLFRSWLGALTRRTHTESVPGLLFERLRGRANAALTDSSLADARAAARAALETALDTLSAKLGPDLASWTWARVNRARFRHALASVFPREADRWEPERIATDGDRSSPAVSGARLPWTFDVAHGPVFRHVVDLAVRDSSLGVVAPFNAARDAGSGTPEMLARWADHRLVPFLLDWRRIDAVAAREDTLGR